MKKARVYDLPTRIFHWLFAGLFILSYFIAETIDDESPLYSYHKLAGIILVAIVVLRIIWGFCGSQYARFSSFELGPIKLVNYFNSMLNAKTKLYLGHNPASSWAAVVMLLFAIGLGVTGVLMSKGINKDLFEDIHELLANGFLVTVIAHVSGVIFHHLKHKDGIGISMISGNKDIMGKETKNIKSHYIIALIFVVIVGLFVFYLNKNYDQKTQNLNLFGVNIELGDNEHSKHHDSHRSHHDDDDDDDD